MYTFNKISQYTLILIAFSCIIDRISGQDHIPDNITFGQATQGGLNGQILRVTTLEANGPGSLREAIQTEGPRIIVFEVGGIIDLKQSNLEVTEPFLTIAGQTAPSPGITLIRGGMGIRTHDIIIKHIRVRPGD